MQEQAELRNLIDGFVASPGMQTMRMMALPLASYIGCNDH